MDYRCPACGRDLARRKLSQAIISRMEIDCPFCLARLVLNVHPLESVLMVASFGGFIGFAALFYFLKRDGFLAAALLSLGAGAMLPLFERAWFRGWRRYHRKPGSEPDSPVRD